MSGIAQFGFNKEEIQVITEDDKFISIQNFLEKELAKVEDSSAEYIDIDELDKFLEDTIRKYET